MLFLEQKVAVDILKAEKEGFKPTAAQEEEFKAQGFDAQDGSVPRIMSIAGDPRIPKDHPLFQKWWSLLDRHLHNIVIGWL